MNTFSVSALPLPLVQAPMAGGPSTPALAAVVSDAGGLGSLAAGYLSASAAEEKIAEFRAMSDGPVAVNVFVPEARPSTAEDVAAYRVALVDWATSSGLPDIVPEEAPASDDDFDAKVAMLARVAPDVVTFTFGLPASHVISTLQRAGVTVGVTITCLDEAAQAVAHDADLLIAQGIEAGGHRSQFDQSAEPQPHSTVELVRSVTHDCACPVIGAGGVDGVAAAQAILDAGAAAVQVGTLFLTTEEAGTKPTHRAALLSAGERPTVLTRVFTGRPARALENDFTRAMDPHAVVGYPQVHVLTGGLRAAAALADDSDHLHLWAGTGYSGCAAEPAAALLDRFAPLRRAVVDSAGGARVPRLFPDDLHSRGTDLHVVLLTGAGLSTAAGIPDFRGPDGVWTRDPLAERTSTLSWYLRDPQVRERSWEMRAATRVWEREATDGHRAIAEFAGRGIRTTIITQNIDGLHQAAGSPDADVLEVHGTAQEWRCEDCRATGAMAEAAARFAEGERDPRCPACGGIIRAQTILFEEALDADVLDAAFSAATSCDVMIAVGTGLSVHPVAGLFPLAAEHGAATAIVNAEPTPFDRIADVVLDGDLQQQLPRLLTELAGIVGDVQAER